MSKLEEFQLVSHSKQKAYEESIEFYGDLMSDELIEKLEGQAQAYGYYVSNPKDAQRVIDAHAEQEND